MIFPIFPILFAEKNGEVGLKPKPVEASCHAALESQHRGHDHGHCGCCCLCDSSSAVQGANESWVFRVFRVFRVFSFQVLYLLHFVMQSGQSLIVRCRTCPTCRSLLSYGSVHPNYVQLKFRSSSWRRLIWQCKQQCRQCSISQHDRKKKRVVSICWNMCWNRGFCQHVSRFQHVARETLRKRWRRPTSAKRRRTWSMRSAEIRRDSERQLVIFITFLVQLEKQ